MKHSVRGWECRKSVFFEEGLKRMLDARLTSSLKRIRIGILEIVKGIECNARVRKIVNERRP